MTLKRTSRWLVLTATFGVAATLTLGACSDPVDNSDSEDSSELDADTAEDSAEPDVQPDAVEPDLVEPDVADAGPEIVEPVALWEVGSLGDSGVITDVHGVSASEAYATSGERVLRFNGSAWAAFGTPAPGTSLHSVWSDGSMVWAVGEQGLVAKRAVTELRWTTVDAGTSETLRAISGRAGNLFAVGDNGTVVHWDADAAEWTSLYSLDGIDLYGVWLDPDAADLAGVFAVGSGGQLVSSGSGTFGSEQIAAADAVLRDVIGVAGDIYAVGTNHTVTVKRTTAPTWQGQATNDTQERDLYALIGDVDDNVYALGARGAIIHYNGSKWTAENAIGPTYVTADLVAATDLGGRFLAIGGAGGGLLQDADGAWNDVATAPSGGLKDIAGSDAEALWGVGPGGLVMTRTDQGWTSVSVPTTEDLHGVDVSADGDVWLVGGAGTVLIVDAASGSASSVDTFLPLDLFGVAVARSGAVVAGKGGTLIEVSADGSVDTLTSNIAADLTSVAVGGDGAVWIAGDFGTLLREDNDDFDVVATGVGGSLNALVANESGVVAAGDNGVLVTADADGASVDNEQPGLFLYGLSHHGGTTLAVGWNGTVLSRGADGAWVSEETGTGAVLEAVWHDDAIGIATGRKGALLRRLEAP